MITSAAQLEADATATAAESAPTHHKHLPGRTALYRLYDADETLLYVGISHDPEGRWRQHLSDKPWAPRVTMRVIEWHTTREEAEAAEIAAIKDERPKQNKRDAGLTPTIQLRIDREVWADFGDATAAMDTDRSKAIREFVDWYLRRPGAKMPKRPEATDD